MQWFRNRLIYYTGYWLTLLILGSKEKLSMLTFILPGPSTYQARVRCTSCTPSRRSCSELRDGQQRIPPWGAKMFDFTRITLFCLGYRLSKQKMTICSKHLEGHGPSWLRLWIPLTFGAKIVRKTRKMNTGKVNITDQRCARPWVNLSSWWSDFNTTVPYLGIKKSLLCNTL